MVAERGEIWWADLGEPRGSSPGFQRPVVIIQSNDFIQTNIRTLIVAVVTSNLQLAEMPGNVRLLKKKHGLAKDSVVNLTQLFTINKEDMLEYVETLSQQKMEQIDKGLRLVLSI